jgi:hypothetical protein
MHGRRFGLMDPVHDWFWKDPLPSGLQESSGAKDRPKIFFEYVYMDGCVEPFQVFKDLCTYCLSTNLRILDQWISPAWSALLFFRMPLAHMGKLFEA